MSLKAHCDMRKQEQRNYIIARELDIPPCRAECLINKNHEQENFNSI